MKNTNFWKKTEIIRPKNRTQSTIFNKNDKENNRNQKPEIPVNFLEEILNDDYHEKTNTQTNNRSRQPESFCSSTANFSRQSSIHTNSNSCNTNNKPTNNPKIIQQYDCQTLLKFINKLPSFILKQHILPHLSVTDIFLLCEMDRNENETKQLNTKIGTNYHKLAFESNKSQKNQRNFIQKHIDWRFESIDSLAQVFYDFSRQRIFEVSEAKYLIVNKIVSRLFDFAVADDETEPPVSPKNLSTLKKIIAKKILSIISTKSYPKKFAVAHIKKLDMIVLDPINKMNSVSSHENCQHKNKTLKKFLQLFELEKINGLRLFCIYSCFVRSWLNFLAGEPKKNNINEITCRYYDNFNNLTLHQSFDEIKNDVTMPIERELDDVGYFVGINSPEYWRNLEESGRCSMVRLMAFALTTESDLELLWDEFIL